MATAQPLMPALVKMDFTQVHNVKFPFVLAFQVIFLPSALKTGHVLLLIIVSVYLVSQALNVNYLLLFGLARKMGFGAMLHIGVLLRILLMVIASSFKILLLFP